MAYFDVSLLAGDMDFLNRCIACATIEGQDDSASWAMNHQWELASTPGFGDAYSSAIVAGVEHPGRDQAVISDSQILPAVQLLMQSP